MILLQAWASWEAGSPFFKDSGCFEKKAEEELALFWISVIFLQFSEQYSLTKPFSPLNVTPHPLQIESLSLELIPVWKTKGYAKIISFTDSRFFPHKHSPGVNLQCAPLFNSHHGCFALKINSRLHGGSHAHPHWSHWEVLSSLRAGEARHGIIFLHRLGAIWVHGNCRSPFKQGPVCWQSLQVFFVDEAAAMNAVKFPEFWAFRRNILLKWG